jgi:outer membrane protein TolC
VTLRVPIFSGFATQSGVRQALYTRDVRQDELEQQRRALERNTRNAYQVVVAGVSEVEARRLALVSARAAYEASQVGLEVGTRTVLDVLINQRNCSRRSRPTRCRATTSCRAASISSRPPARSTSTTCRTSIAC